jgi:type II secretory pathway component PulF
MTLNFTYQVRTKDGELRSGEVIAKSAVAALEELESQGLTVLFIRQAEVPANEVPTSRPHALPETTGKHVLRNRVAQLLEKRETLGPALTAFAEELPKGKSRRELTALAQRIQTGASVDELTQPPTLTNIWLPLIGSESTIGASHLQDVLAEAERDYANRSYIARSLAYPAVLFCMALAVLVFLGIFIIPTFRAIFDDFALQLPSLTKLILNFSHILLYRPLQFLAMLALVVAGLYGTIWLLRRWILPSRWLGLFLDGNSQQVAEMASFVRHLAESLNAGLPLADALLVIGSNTKHRWLRWESLRLYDNLNGGADNHTALKNSTLPATVTFALQAGPQGTPHVGLLQTIAESYSDRIRDRFRWATGFLPQVAVLSIGIIVALVVIAIFLPLVTLINGLSG